jgi:hypothetical protein
LLFLDTKRTNRKLAAKTLADNRGHHNEQVRASNAIEQQLSSQTQNIVEKIAILAQQ